MGKLTKNQKLAAEKIEAGKAYSLKEAAQLVKEITYTKFDASLDIDVRLGVDPRKANQYREEVIQHLSPSGWPYAGQRPNVRRYPEKRQTWYK